MDFAYPNRFSSQVFDEDIPGMETKRTLADHYVKGQSHETGFGVDLWHTSNL